MPSGKTIAARTNTASVPPPKATPDAVKLMHLPSFIIGVWYQPVSSFPKWKARGINTLVGIELENGGQPGTPAQQAAFVKAGHDAGFASHGEPPRRDASRSMDPTSPTAAATSSPPPTSPATPSSKQPTPASWCSATSTAKRPMAQPRQITPVPLGYFAGADLISFDWYPVNRGMVPEDGFKIYADRVAWAVRVAAGKPVLVFIECSDQGMRVQDYLHSARESADRRESRRCDAVPDAGRV
jgi:hypothetical protein